MCGRQPYEFNKMHVCLALKRLLLESCQRAKLINSEADKNKSKSTGWTSMDRSTKATLVIYNTRIQLSRVQKTYRIQKL